MANKNSSITTRSRGTPRDAEQPKVSVIPRFALHWDLGDLTKAMGNRSVLWTDPTNWMGRPVPLGPPYQYRYVLGDTTDLSDEQDDMYIRELIR